MLVEIKVPVLAESVSTATLMQWQKQIGEQVRRGDNLIDIETDKVTLEITALNDGVITEILKTAGEDVESDEVIARIDTEATEAVNTDEPLPTQQSLPDITSTKAAEASTTDSPKLSPAVRNMLHEHQLDATTIPSTTDRITKADVLDHLQTDHKKEVPPAEATKIVTPPPAPVESSSVKPAATETATPAPITSAVQPRTEKKVAMTRLRKRIADRLLNAQQENAILTTFNEVNMQPIMDIRSKYKDEFEKVHGTKLGFMSFFTRIAVEALKQFPIINASVAEEDIIYHNYFDVGIAVSSPRGLVVPIIRDVDTLSLADIEATIKSYGAKARDGKLTIEDLTGGTFTITNGGVFGSLLSTPIINPPQSAILGMHTIQQRPIAQDNEVVIRPMMYLALSYDHRIIDGREAVQFLVSMKKQLEDPARFLLQI